MSNKNFEFVRVKFIGSRVPPMRVMIYINGRNYSPNGHIFGAGVVRQVLKVEADVLTGKTPPVIEDDGTIKTGYVVEGDLGEAGLTGEGYEIVTEEKKATKPADVPVAAPAA